MSKPWDKFVDKTAPATPIGIGKPSDLATPAPEQSLPSSEPHGLSQIQSHNPSPQSNLNVSSRNPALLTRPEEDQPPSLPPPLNIDQRFHGNRQPYYNPNPYSSMPTMYNSYGSNTYPSYGQSMLPYGQQYGHQFYGQQFGQYQTQPLAQGTQQAFFVLEQLVQTISGFSQMLESTFHATQSSFMAMLGLANQFHQLRSFMMDIFSIRSIMDPIKRILGSQVMDDSEKIRASGKKPSKLPLFLFLAFAFGFPWFVSRLLRLLEQRPQVGKPLTELQFAQALYDYKGNSPNELSLRSGDVVAILDRCLESWNPTKETAWWQGRLQNGTVGIFPSNYVKLLNIETKSTTALEDKEIKK